MGMNPSADKQPLRVALDISPLFHTTTSGIATYLIELTKHLPEAMPRDQFTWFYCAPWRSNARTAPCGLPAHTPPVPPRLLQLGWRIARQPSVRYLADNPDVF